VYRYVFTEPAGKDLYAFRRNARLLIRLLHEVIPAVLADPRKAGEPKRGDLAAVFASGFHDQGTAYRLIYTIDDNRRLVTFIAFGPHDTAYAHAKRRV